MPVGCCAEANIENSFEIVDELHKPEAAGIGEGSNLTAAPRL